MWRKPLDADVIVRPQGNLRIENAWCKGCEYCTEFCPTDVLVLSSDFNAKGYHYPIVQTAADCVDCKLCELLCPEYAIVVTAVATKADGATAASGSDDDGASALAPLNVLMVGG